MSALLLSKDTPKQNSLFYNCENQLAMLLEFLQRRRLHPFKRDMHRDVSLIFSTQKQVAQKLLVHACRTLPTLLNKKVDLLWIVVDEDSTYMDVGERIHSHLAARWASSSGANSMEDLSRAMSFQLESSGTPVDYVTLNLLPLSSIIELSHIVCAIDLFCAKNVDHKKVAPIIELMVELQSKTTRLDVDTVILSHDRSRQTLKRINGLTPINVPDIPESIMSLINEKQSAREESESIEEKILSKKIFDGRIEEKAQINPDPDLISAMRILHPLIALHQPASERVLRYLPEAADVENQLIWKNIVEKFLDPTTARGATVNIDGKNTYDSLRRSRVLPGPIYDDHIPNAAKMFCFARPETFFSLNSTIGDMEKYLYERGRLVDYCAAMVAAKIQQKPSDKHLSQVLSKYSERRIFSESRIDEARIILSYLSQLLLTDRYQLGREVFSILESLTYGFNDFLMLSKNHEHTDLVLEGAGWIKNLGYVYDKNKRLGNGVINNYFGERREYSSKAAKILEKITPNTVSDFANIEYHLGWEMADAGDLSGAANTFLYAAKTLIEQAPPSNSAGHNDEFAFELAVQSLVFFEDSRKDERANHAIYRMLKRYGLFLSINDIIGFLGKNSTISLPLNIESASHKPADCGILCSTYDLATATAIASYLVHRKGKMVILAVLGEKALSEDDVQRVVKGLPNRRFVIGGPATPHGIGRFVSMHLKPIDRLYQYEKVARHNHWVEDAKSSTVFLTGRGICSTLDAWYRWLASNEQVINQGKSMLETVFTESFVFPILKVARDRVVTIIVDSVVDLVKSRLSSNGDEINEDDINVIANGLCGAQASPAQDAATQDSIPTGLSSGLAQMRFSDQRVLTVLFDSLSPKSVPEFLAAVQQRTNKIRVEIDEILMLNEIGLRICQYIEDSSSSSGVDIKTITDEFRNGFRQLSVETERLKNRMLRGGESREAIDPEVAKLATRLSRVYMTLTEESVTLISK